jgi:hypothetical protein
MRFLEVKSKTAARDITSRSYFINITVSDVNPVHIDRLSRKGAESILLATNNTVSANFDCACAVRCPTVVNKKALQDSLRSRHILPCVWEAAWQEPSATGSCMWTQSQPRAIRGLADLWSRSPWTMIYEGAGTAAGRTASGLHIQLPFCLNLAQSPQSPPKFSSS